MKELTDPPPLQPRWAAGVDLRQTTADCVQVVGDVPLPIALRGINASWLDWLTQLDGQRAWNVQLSEAEARGIPIGEARRLLEQLADAQLLVDGSSDAPRSPFHDAVIVGSNDLAQHITGVLVGVSTEGVIPKPRDGDHWRLSAEELVDAVAGRPTIVALDSPWIDAAELEFVGQLIDKGVHHVVVGAGARSARVGPLTIDGMGPCTRCDELLRADMDPSWRQLSAQLALDHPPVGSRSLAALAAAEVARQIESLTPTWDVAALNAVLKSGYQGRAWQGRPLTRHLKCACWWPR